MPLVSTATPCGWLKRAPLPVPSALPLTPGDPAQVLTTPPAVIFRIVRLSVSVTYKMPVVSAATPQGLAKRAATPVPSALPWPGELESVVIVSGWERESGTNASDSATDKMASGVLIQFQLGR